MKKVAFFVEGQTERIFIEKLLEEVFTYPKYDIESYSIVRDKASIVRGKRVDNNLDYFFLIFDVSGDGKVTSTINERANNLLNKNDYSHIFGIRDLYPEIKTSKSKIEDSIIDIFTHNNIDVSKVSLFIAVMEIEAWFLASYSHYANVNPALSIENINSNLKIKIDTDDIESYSHPAMLIDNIFNILGRRYDKHKHDAYSICSFLDYAAMYLDPNLRSRIPSFDAFLTKFDEIIEGI
jgi:hypothetical protein